MGDTPLAWAARNGHKEVVRMLLGRDDIEPDKPGEDGQTPLLLASRNGHEGVVRALLERDGVNPNKPDGRGRTHSRTPLVRGARKWWKYYSGGVMSIPTSGIGTA